MAGIQSGLNAATLATVGDTSKGIYAEIRNAVGGSLALQHGTNISGNPYGVMMAGINDKTSRTLRTDRIGSIRPGFDTLLFNAAIEGVTLNTNIWNFGTASMVQAQTNVQGINFNSTSILTASAASFATTWKQFSKSQLSPLRARIRTRVIPQTNGFAEFGFMNNASTSAQNTNGFTWRYTTSGTVLPVVAYNSVDLFVGTDISASLNSANYYTWGIIVDDDNVVFTCQDTSTGFIISEQTYQLPLGTARFFQTARLPFQMRVFNNSAMGAAIMAYMSDCVVTQLDINQNKPWSHQMITSMGFSSDMNPLNYSVLANITNSAAAGAMTLSNTTSTYANTLLDGFYNFVAVAGAATDYIVYSFLVPAAYTFVCTGIKIDAYNVGAAVATTPTLMHWHMVNQGSSSSLATASLPRKHLGTMSFPIGAAIGANATPIAENWEMSPFRTEGGRVFTIAMRMPVATATASQSIQGGIRVNGYFE